jgi:hypothetical protein
MWPSNRRLHDADRSLLEGFSRENQALALRNPRFKHRAAAIRGFNFSDRLAASAEITGTRVEKV